MAHALLLLFCFAAAIAVGDVARADATTEVDALRARAEAYWKARLAKSDLYEFYLPEEHGGVSRDKFHRGNAVAVESAEVTKVEINDDTGVVEVNLHIARFSFRMSPQMARAIQANDEFKKKRLRNAWLNVDGVWYREPRRPFGGKFDPVTINPGQEPGASSGGEETQGLSSVRSREN